MVRKTKHNFKALTDGLSDVISQDDKWQTYKCHLVTPMYGGGVEAGKVDTAMPIRASSIRGQLRFWWRIACGPFNSPREMFDKETAIWGGIGGDAKASQVEIRVSNANFKGEVAAFEYKRHKDRSEFQSVPKPDPNLGHAYVLFSAHGKLSKDKTVIEEWPHKIAKTGLSFDLQLSFKTHTKGALTPEQINEVKEAIRWWASFGGVGSRTRRGLGAVEVKLKDKILQPVTCEEVEKKGGVLTLVSLKEKQDAVVCWKYGCDKLRDFRQGKKIGRNEGSSDPKRPGQSRWPEPDQLRRFTGNWKLNHDPEHPAGNVFPRSAFGMPIIFDFNDRSNKEPNTMTLLPKGEQRMASPLIIRPYKDGEKWRAAALLLPNWEKALVEPLELSPSSSHIKPRSWPDENQQAERDRLTDDIKPMKGRPNDPLSAFLDYFKQGQ